MAKKEGLSSRQKMVYDFLKEEIRSKGYPPSVREIGAAVGLSSTSSVHAHLETLERKKYIRRQPSKNRSIEILEKGFYQSDYEYINVPIVGNITAGAPIFAQEEIEDFFPVPVQYIGNHETFFLNVKGSSMIQAGIFDGDLALIKKQASARNGEIVVALIEDTATLKTFYKEKKRIRLQPENDDYEPIIVDDVIILGVLIALFRSY